MKARAVLAYTHDSNWPRRGWLTHQAVERLASLRLTPNFGTWRPSGVGGSGRSAGGAWRLSSPREQTRRR
ncbi:hypothetical protein ACNKHU_14960 [Shigella flexneri]